MTQTPVTRSANAPKKGAKETPRLGALKTQHVVEGGERGRERERGGRIEKKEEEEAEREKSTHRSKGGVSTVEKVERKSITFASRKLRWLHDILKVVHAIVVVIVTASADAVAFLCRRSCGPVRVSVPLRRCC